MTTFDFDREYIRNDSGIASPYNESALRVDQYLRLQIYKFTAFLYVDQSDQSSPHLLEHFGEDIPTSPEVIEAHTLIFKPNFKFSRLKFGVGTPVLVRGCAR